MWVWARDNGVGEGGYILPQNPGLAPIRLELEPFFFVWARSELRDDVDEGFLVAQLVRTRVLACVELVENFRDEREVARDDGLLAAFLAA